jgi:hypothetical protein
MRVISSGLPLTVQAASHAPASSVQWGDVATWVLAVGALGALIAAGLAYALQDGASRKLAEQVSLQHEQLKDQQRANHLQAKVLEAQLRQIQQRAEGYERQQADAITLTPSSSAVVLQQGMRLPPDATVYEALVLNGSPRPIRNATCHIKLASGAGSTYKADFVSRYVETADGRRLREQDEGSQVVLARAGETWAFNFQHEFRGYSDARMTLRFTDDAGLHWQIDHDLHLQKLDNRDDW